MQTKNHKQLWAECLQIIKKVIGDEAFASSFSDVTSLSYENNELRLLVPSPYIVEVIEGEYITELGRAIVSVYGPHVQLHYHYNVVGNQPDTRIDVKSTTANTSMARGADNATVAKAQKLDPHLNSRFTFDNYCSSESNKDAIAIAKSIADNPNVKTFNPLFIFGATGLGKTHLIQACGLRIIDNRPSTRVLYITAREFESQFTTATLKGETNKFFAFYQSIDTLIVDDVQDLNGKDKTQNTFYNIFNYLYLNNKQIIMSCDRAPSQMVGFESRMLGRFKQGIQIELYKPDMALRREVLVKRAEAEGVRLEPEIVEYIITNVTESIRELEGVMVSLVAHATVMSKPISLELARRVVGNAVKIKPKTVNFEIIVREVSNYYGIDADLLFTKSRKSEISDARQVLMYLAKKLAKMPLTTIGQRIGRTHATVIYAVKHIEELVEHEATLKAEIEKIEAAVMA